MQYITHRIEANAVRSSSKRRQQNKQDSAGRNLIVVTVTWTTYVTANVSTVVEEAATAAEATAGAEAKMTEILGVVAEEEEVETLVAAVAETLIVGQDVPDHRSIPTHQEE